MSKVQINLNSKKAIYALLGLCWILILVIVMQQANLSEQRKQTIATSGFCIKNTADVTANYQLALMREQDAHKRDVDKANANIDFLVNEYNKTAKKKISFYSYRVYPSLP